MKIYQLLSLPALYNSISDKNLPFALAYKLSKLATQVNEELKFYQENLTKIIEEYGEKENGELIYLSNGDIKIQEGKAEECHARIEELQNVEVDIKVTFTPNELEPLEMSIKDLQALMPLINE